MEENQDHFNSSTLSFSDIVERLNSPFAHLSIASAKAEEINSERVTATV